VGLGVRVGESVSWSVERRLSAREKSCWRWGSRKDGMAMMVEGASLSRGEMGRREGKGRERKEGEGKKGNGGKERKGPKVGRGVLGRGGPEG
jgi:hypothetical protein